MLAKEPNIKKYKQLYQYKAAAVIAALYENGFSEHLQSIKLNGGFKQKYRYDLDKIIDNGNNIIELYFNLDSLYDLLPEGLFHQTMGVHNVDTLESAVAEHKKYLKEEKNARRFFEPFDELLIRYEAMAEMIDQQLTGSIQQGEMNESFYDFWDLSDELLVPHKRRLLKIMPHLYQIKGNKSETAIALSFLLEMNVGIENRTTMAAADKKNAMAICEMKLGVDSALGSLAPIEEPCWFITLDNIDNIDILLSSNAFTRSLEEIFDLLLPVEVDYKINYSTSKKKCSQDSPVYYLGKNAVLN